jgi:hypothetical protein
LTDEFNSCEESSPLICRANPMEIDMTNAEKIAAVEVFLLAKAQFDQAEAILKQAKKAVVEAAGGYGFLEGETADLDIAVQAKTVIKEELLRAVLAQEQIDACKVEGAAYSVVRVKAKKVAKAA